MILRKLFFLLFIFSPVVAVAQRDRLNEALNRYFSDYRVPGFSPRNAPAADSLRLDEAVRSLTIYVNESFASQTFTPAAVKQVYGSLQRRLPAPYNAYRLRIITHKGMPLEELVPNILRENTVDASRLWGDVEYKGEPWVKNLSKAYRVTRGLEDRHLFVWPGHGRYFHDGKWRWQRPYLFCTTEDLFTQSYVYPYLLPMLENAGAVVSSPRERDGQTQEAVVDNDNPQQCGNYAEVGQEDVRWQPVPATAGFARPVGLLNDSVFPFLLGTVRQATATRRHTRLATATWTPNIPKRGRYAVYVSYASRPNSVPDAQYTIYHRGGRSRVQVNQQMGGGTWVYVGTYEFEAGTNATGRVVLGNNSNHRGVVTADAVRFGGGVGQVDRENAGASGLPRQLEAARYYAQWAGLVDTLFNTEQGLNDYKDDLRARSNLLNYLSEGSPYNPSPMAGAGAKRVPFELSLAIHSDAGRHVSDSLYGSLAICTTVTPDSLRSYPSGLSRHASQDLAFLLLQGAVRDLSPLVKRAWTRRELWDRNYAETRMPAVPSAIFEMLSHQNYWDMRYGHDPHFKFTMARSIYKSVLAYVNYMHGRRNYAVQPLPPHRFSALLSEDGGQVRLQWQPTTDKLEKTAAPTGYVVYSRVEGEGFDNGRYVDGAENTMLEIPVSRGLQYSFYVTAVNAGGESFPSETLTAYSSETPQAPRVLLVNAFTRLSGPARVETADSLGFDLDLDPGVPYVSTNALAGRQRNFSRAATKVDDGPEALGYSTGEWVGNQLAGNTFDYPVAHGRSLAATGRYSFSSCGESALSETDFPLSAYAAIDYIAGLQQEVGYNLVPAPVFTSRGLSRLKAYAQSGGKLLVSGSYVGSDLRTKAERAFAREVLGWKSAGTARADSTDYVNGLNLQFLIYRRPSAAHYAAVSPDVLAPASPQAFTAFAYGGGKSGGVAYSTSSHRALTLGFPFECIVEETVRNQAMEAMMRYLIGE